jgi:uncharacterized lipoprotein
LVLPKNYGWGARVDGDKVWGIYAGDEKMHKIWGLLQTTLQEHSFEIDIVNEDARYPLLDQYQLVYTTNDLG